MKATFGTANKTRKYRHNVSSRHITTMGVNDVKVSNILNVRKGEKISVDYSQFSRLAPLVTPTFGSWDIKTFAFFTPIISIWQHYDAFRKDTTDSSISQFVQPINLSMYYLLYPIIDNWSETVPSNMLNEPHVKTAKYGNFPDLSSNSYKEFVMGSDMQLVHTAGSGGYGVMAITFDYIGRQYINLLTSLGYAPPTFLKWDAGDEGIFQFDPTSTTLFYARMDYSIYPLLAVARVFYDYLYPSYYVEQRGYGYLFTDDIYTQRAELGDEFFFRATLLDIFDLINTNIYSPHFFTQLWQTPTEVVRGSQKNVHAHVEVGVPNRNNVFFNLDSTENSIAGSASNTSLTSALVTQNGASSYATLNATALRFLQSIADFAIRNNLGGNRIRDFYREHFGYVTNEQKPNESLFLKVFSDSIQIQDVTNIAQSSDAALGEQGGKGISGGQNRLNFESSSDGFLIFITMVQPKIGYYQGIKPWCRELTDRFQLFTPEYDGVSMEAVPRSSVFAQYRDASDWNKAPFGQFNQVFGFAPMYSERYKVGHDTLSGDFLFGSRNQGLDSYHTFRDVLFGRNNLALDLNFQRVDNQTQRAFAYIGNDEGSTSYNQDDKMFTFLSFDTIRYSPIQPLTRSIPLFDESGRDVSMNYEGTGMSS